jgi:hypothetical protein
VVIPTGRTLNWTIVAPAHGCSVQAIPGTNKATVTAGSEGATITVRATDSEVYDEYAEATLDVVKVNSLDVCDANDTNNVAVNPSTTALYVPETAAGIASIVVTGQITPNNATTGQAVLWKVDGANGTVASGDCTSGYWVDLDPTGGDDYRVFQVKLGFDSNHNGIFDDPVLLTTTVYVVKVEFSRDPITVRYTGSTTVDATVHPPSCREKVHFQLVTGLRATVTPEVLPQSPGTLTVQGNCTTSSIAREDTLKAF